jgi:2,3-bisphosphoglycerate-dependent phosphoglycerate mutase
MNKPLPGTLIIARHGESEWNALGKWTGTTDVHLTPKGQHEAMLMGEELKDIHFDQAYYSEQIRTKETLDGILTAAGQTEIAAKRTGAINERDYGIYTGKNKWEVKEAIGDEAFHGLRRDWDYHVDGGETLKDVYERVLPFYKDEVLPRLAKGETVLLVAHGNSIRALVKYLESVPEARIAEVEMIFGTALIYQVDEAGLMTHKEVRQIQTVLPPA